MRCCILTIQKDSGPDEEGRKIPCKYCKSEMIFKGPEQLGWRWAGDRKLSSQT